MAREIVLDANVIIAQLNGADALAVRAQEMTARLSGASFDAGFDVIPEFRRTA